MIIASYESIEFVLFEERARPRKGGDPNEARDGDVTPIWFSKFWMIVLTHLIILLCIIRMYNNRASHICLSLTSATGRRYQYHAFISIRCIIHRSFMSFTLFWDFANLADFCKISFPGWASLRIKVRNRWLLKVLNLVRRRIIVWIIQQPI